MVTALPELHENVEHSHLCHLACSVHDINILHQDLSVPLPLHLREPNVDLDFFLWWKLLLHFRFESSQKERSKYAMKSLDQLGVLEPRLTEPCVKILHTGDNSSLLAVNNFPHVPKSTYTLRATSQGRFRSKYLKASHFPSRSTQHMHASPRNQGLCSGLTTKVCRGLPHTSEELKTSGRRKFKRAHSSWRLF